MRVTIAFLFLICATGVAAAHPPPPPPDYYMVRPDIVTIPPETSRSVWEGQVGGGAGVFAASLERWFGFSIGWHRVRSTATWLIGNERGIDLDLRVAHARDGSAIVVGLRPVARRLQGDWRVPSLTGLVLPEVAVSSGDGRERALRVEWSLPIATSIGKHSAIEWDLVKGGVVFSDDGVHASIGSEVRFVLR
ncbi:MAG TPA: hypothetical protein VL463_11305 [Kofleriaceae bacterium]|jgi:hypothetical protein|nr:hypothetical protein [Kofleriaceae bacterium]